MNVLRAHNPRNGRSAISIVEVLILLMTITLIACLAITTFFKRPEVTLDSAVELLMEDMLIAKNRALVTHSPVSVTFYEDGRGYEVRDKSGRLLPSPAGIGDFIRDYDYDAVFEGVAIAHVEFGDDRSLTFDRSGMTLEDGYVVAEFRGETRTVEMTREGGVRLRKVAD